MTTAYEVNFDGLIGPTHNYGGLSYGNIASSNNAMKVSHPRQAARQGLAKMKFLHDLGLKQGVFLPQERPHIPTLRKLGFRGTDKEIIIQAGKQAPQLLTNCYSASSMWAANAATVSPSADTADKRVHFTPANLSSMFHRSIEHPKTGSMLRSIFSNEKYFVHHDALPSSSSFGDEGAANHNRLCRSYGEAGVELFIYGRQSFEGTQKEKTTFPARQSLEASQTVSRNHQLTPNNVVFAKQSKTVIEAGGFHNDVVSVCNQNIFFMHEEAFDDTQVMFDELQSSFGNEEILFIVVPSAEVPLGDAITSYLFNSQLITLPEGKGMALILPEECRNNEYVFNYLTKLIALDTPIKYIHFVDIRQSMCNGGGPACLRLRVVLTETELSAVNPQFIFSEDLFSTLNEWVDSHYREELYPQDLLNPHLMDESRTALDELTQIFNMGSFYDFQKN